MKDLNNKLILKYMAQVENKTGKCFHEIDADLEQRCIDALDGKIKASFVIAQLTKLIDELAA